MAQGGEGHGLPVLEDLQRGIRACAERAAGPERAAILAAQPEGRERAAVVQVHADPVPAHGLGVHQGLAPLVVQPGARRARGSAAVRADGKAPARQRDGAEHCQLGLAVVVARLLRLRPLARQALAALQDERLGAVELQFQGEAFRRNAGGVPAAAVRGAAAGQRPVTDPDGGVGFLRLCHAEACARDALVVQQPAAAHVGERGVREQQLVGREGGAQRAGLVHPGAEEGDLETPVLAVLPGVSGDVPPLGAQVRVAAVVARECQGTRGQRVRRPGHPRAGGRGTERGGEAGTARRAARHGQASMLAWMPARAAAQSPMVPATHASSK